MNVLPTAYLAPISYFQHITQSSEPEIEIYETFPKQTLRNRCYILGANGVQMLTIPVSKSESKLTRDIKISYQQHWQHIHWMAIVSAYKHSAFFDYYADYLEPFYTQSWEWLVDYNSEQTSVILALLHNQPTLRPAIPTTNTWQGNDLEPIWEGNITPYYQLFTADFVNNLSIIDLLFNMGAESLSVLQNYEKAN